jgi:hypothetical protein
LEEDMTEFLGTDGLLASTAGRPAKTDRFPGAFAGLIPVED